MPYVIIEKHEIRVFRRRVIRVIETGGVAQPYLKQSIQRVIKSTYNLQHGGTIYEVDSDSLPIVLHLANKGMEPIDALNSKIEYSRDDLKLFASLLEE